MKKATVFTLGIIFTLLLFTSAAFAWDDLITYTQGSVVGDPGNFYAGAMLRYSTAGDMYDADGESQELADDATGIRVPIFGSYNVMENLQAFALVPIVSMDDGTDSESGIGDVWIGGKYAVLGEGLLAIRGALDIPTGDDEKGLGNAGGFGIDVAALSRRKLNDQFSVTGAVGLRWNGEDSDTEWAPGIAFHVRGDINYRATEKVNLFANLVYFNQGDGEAGGTEITDSGVNWLDIHVGGSYHITEVCYAGLAIGFTPAGTNTNSDLGIVAWIGRSFMR